MKFSLFALAAVFATANAGKPQLSVRYFLVAVIVVIVNFHSML
jgi:hypothetical protein